MTEKKVPLFIFILRGPCIQIFFDMSKKEQARVFLLFSDSKQENKTTNPSMPTPEQKN
jgi:hypothetical protein